MQVSQRDLHDSDRPLDVATEKGSLSDNEHWARRQELLRGGMDLPAYNRGFGATKKRPSKNGNPGPKRLKPVHRQIIKLHLRGKAQAAIAKSVGMAHITISRFLASDKAQKIIQDRIQASERDLLAQAPMAVDAVRQALAAPMDETRLKGVDRFIKLSEYMKVGEESKKTAEDFASSIFANATFEGPTQLNVNVSPKETSLEKLEDE